MLVVTYGSALAAYISQVLPALGVHGVGVITFQTWVARELRRALPNLDAQVVDEAPAVVTRLKNHPALLEELERRARAHRGPRTARAVLELWAELLTDRDCLLALLTGDPTAPLREAEVTEALRLMRDRIAAFVDREPGTRRRRDRTVSNPTTTTCAATPASTGWKRWTARTVLDLEDAAILLRTHQLLRGVKRPLAHLFVDEAQDLSPMQLSTLIGTTTAERSVTLAGDTAQRLLLDSGFLDWRTVLRQLGLAHVAVEPLKISYRSTREILALARHVMGPLADPEPPRAPRSGAPVEAHRFPGTGAAVAFLAEALRPLFAREPRATVAILTRHREEADRYFQGLKRAEVPMLRRVRDQEFAFRPGSRGDRDPPGQGPGVRLRGGVRGQRQRVRHRRRIPPPAPHRRHPRRPPALAGGHLDAQPAPPARAAGLIAIRPGLIISVMPKKPPPKRPPTPPRKPSKGRNEFGDPARHPVRRRHPPLQRDRPRPRQAPRPAQEEDGSLAGSRAGSGHARDVGGCLGPSGWRGGLPATCGKSFSTRDLTAGTELRKCSAGHHER